MSLQLKSQSTISHEPCNTSPTPQNSRESSHNLTQSHMSLRALVLDRTPHNVQQLGANIDLPVKRQPHPLKDRQVQKPHHGYPPLTPSNKRFQGLRQAAPPPSHPATKRLLGFSVKSCFSPPLRQPHPLLHPTATGNSRRCPPPFSPTDLPPPHPAFTGKRPAGRCTRVACAFGGLSFLGRKGGARKGAGTRGRSREGGWRAGAWVQAITLFASYIVFITSSHARRTSEKWLLKTIRLDGFGTNFTKESGTKFMERDYEVQQGSPDKAV